MMPKHRRGPWSQAEDNHLLQLVQEQGAHNWVRIAHLIGSRSPKQCRERFHQNLKPSLNLEPITPQEGVLIEKMVAEMGKRWAEIARRLRGRSDNAVKNWWNGGMNRRKRLDYRRAEMTPRQPHTHQNQIDTRVEPVSVSRSVHDAKPQTHQIGLRNEGAPVHNPPHVPSCMIRPPPYPSIRRKCADGTAPSPSTMSCTSRADSSEGGPPSLISDYSVASLTTSPNASPPVHGLPPLYDTHYDARRYSHQQSLPSPLHYDGESRTWIQHSPKVEWSHHQQQQAPTPHWSTFAAKAAASSPTTLPVSGPQMPLPDFKTITAPIPQPAPQPQSAPSPKDSRMDLSNLVH